MTYLDNAATTFLSKRAAEEINRCNRLYQGNPSSAYSLGRAARDVLDAARYKCAKSINADPEQIIFTSSGSEANNMVINSYATSLVSAIEHHSILARGTVGQARIPVDSEGYVHPNELKDYLQKMNNTHPLVSIMMVNNEIGTIQDIKQHANIAHSCGAAFHTDAVQAFGHMPIDVKELNVDYMSVSAHKIHGPKGVGFLYAKNPETLKPLIYGTQNFNLRGGTENISLISAFGIACEEAVEKMTYNTNVCEATKASLYMKLKLKYPGIFLNGPKLEDRVANNINICIPGIDAAELIEYCSMRDMFFSSGSACNSESSEPSHVLKAIGLSDDEANSSIRITVDQSTTLSEVERVAMMISTFIKIHN